MKQVKGISTDVKTNRDSIVTKTKLIETIKKEEEIELEQKEAAKREEALQRLIDQELEADNKQIEKGNYSIQDSSKNPMDAVLNK